MNSLFLTEVIFLDIDGVLQTPALDCWKELEHCHELAKLLDKSPKLAVVVSSSHREGRTLAEMREFLPKEIGQRVVGLTPVTPRCRARGGRQDEIVSWLQAHPTVTHFAAVDDEPHLYADECPWLVQTHPYIGWNEEVSRRISVLLGYRPANRPTMAGVRLEIGQGLSSSP